MAIFNGTPHQINIFNESDCEFDASVRKLILKDGAKPIMTIDKGTPLNAVISNEEIGKINGVTVKNISFSSVDNPFTTFPKAEDNDAFIVSNLYVSAAREIGMDGIFYTVGGTVYASASDPKPVGCLFLIKN